MKATYDNAFCMDSKCIHYFEDTCMVAMAEKGTEIAPYNLEYIEKHGRGKSKDCPEFRAGSHLLYVVDLGEEDFMENKPIMKVVCKGEKPSYANKYAAGLDLRANEEVVIYPKETVVKKIKRIINKILGRKTEPLPNIVDIKSKLAVEIPKGHFGMVVARSGLSYKRQIKLINDVGIIDEDYRGDIGIRLINEGKEPYLIKAGDRVAQMIIIPYIQPELVYVDELGETERGKSGFGSTGR